MERFRLLLSQSVQRGGVPSLGVGQKRLVAKMAVPPLISLQTNLNKLSGKRKQTQFIACQKIKTMWRQIQEEKVEKAPEKAHEKAPEKTERHVKAEREKAMGREGWEVVWLLGA